MYYQNTLPLNRSLDKNRRPKRSLQKIYETNYGKKIMSKIEDKGFEYTDYEVKNEEKDFIQKVLDFGKIFLDRTR